MEFCQSVFSNDEYKYFLEDHPCPHVGLIGCERSTREAIANAFAGLQYRPARLFVSSHESAATVYSKKERTGTKNLTGVMKLGWWKKHQERVLGCAVLLVDWDATQAADRVQFEAIMQKHLDAIKAHLKVPSVSNTKIILGLVCAAKGLTDPSPCGSYITIEEAQSALRSRLGLSDRNILALYQRGMDQYSVQRLENMIMEQVSRYHKDEIARLRKAKSDASEAVAASVQDGDVQHGASAMESLLIARNRFKIAWHATVSKDTKLARRSWEKCYNALHSLPPPLSVDRWVIATIALWKLISDNFFKFSNPQGRDAPSDVGASIESDIQAFLTHLNWVVDRSFAFHGGSSDKSLVPRTDEPTPSLVAGRLSDAEALLVITREWYLADFYAMVSNRLDALKEYLPRPGAGSLGTRMVCLPAFHLQNVVRCLSRVKDVMLSRLSSLDKGQQGSCPVALDRVRPAGSPAFIGREGYDESNLMPFLTTISIVDLLARIKANIFNAIVWYQSYGLVQLVATMQLEVAENDCIIGNYGDAVQRLNRLLKDPMLMQWRDVSLALHEVRFQATRSLLELDTCSKPPTPSANSPVPVHARNNSATEYFMTGIGSLTAHRDMLSSLLFLLFHSSNNATKSQRYKSDLAELMGKFPLTESFSRAGSSSVAAVASAPPSNPVFIDVSPSTMADRMEGSDGRGTIRSGKGARMCHVTTQDAVIFPLFKAFVHFTKPFVESWKGAIDCEVAPSKRQTSGLRISIECSATTPLRLYNVEVHLYHVSTDMEGGRRRRVLIPEPIRLCWFGDDRPSHFIEVSSKAPVWSTTLFSLPFLTNLGAGTYECGGISALLYVSQSGQSSSVAEVSFDGVRDTLDGSARRRSVGGSEAVRAVRGSDYSGARSAYASLPPASVESAFTTVPIYYNFSSAIEDDYIALFEDYCFDSSESRIHSFLAPQKGGQNVRTHGQSASITAPRHKPRATSFAYSTNSAPLQGRLQQDSSRSAVSSKSSGAQSSLASFANMLILEGHRFGSGSSPGCYYSHLHRPIIRLTKPVLKMSMEAVVPPSQQVLEGDDHIIPLMIESRGDQLQRGRLLIPYLEDIVDLVEVRSITGEEVDISDVTGTTPEIRAATPVGYRIAEIVLLPQSIMPLPSKNSRLVLNIRVRCSYAGLFELPLRLDYATPKCDTMTLLHLLRIHVCRPFISSFKIYDLHLLEGAGGSEKALLNRAAAVPDLSSTAPPCASSAAGGDSRPFDPFAENTFSEIALPAGTADLLMSEYMSICHGERQELVSVGRIAEIQRAFDRDPRMANVVVNLAAQRLAKAFAIEGGSSVQQRDVSRQVAHNQFYHVERILSMGQSVQVSPDRFNLQVNAPFVVRACFINTIRCPVRIERLEMQLADGVCAAFRSEVPSSQVLLPAEEITFALQVKATRVFQPDECMGKIALHVRRVSDANGRAVDPTVSSLCGGGFPLRFMFHFPRVPVNENVLSCFAAHPTTLFVAEPFTFKVTVVNRSAVPSRKLRLQFMGPTLDRVFILTGRAQSSFVVPGLGTIVIPVTMTPLVPGAYNLPLYELALGEDVLARSQDIHPVEVLPRLAKSK